MSMKWLYGVLAVPLLVPAWIHASPMQPAQDPLETVKSVTCAFSLYATGTWQNTEPHAEVKPAKLSVAFDSIDTQEGSAHSVGPYGSLPIVVRWSAGTLHFMQVSTSGALYLTTVFGKESTPGKRLAVHSRHEYTAVSLPGFTSRPEQYYGECEIRP